MLNRIKNGHKITKRGEWNLQFKPSNLPEELQHLYEMIGRNSNDFGGTRIVCKTESTTIFGKIISTVETGGLKGDLWSPSSKRHMVVSSSTMPSKRK
jgi:hypothetical protein